MPRYLNKFPILQRVSERVASRHFCERPTLEIKRKTGSERPMWKVLGSRILHGLRSSKTMAPLTSAKACKLSEISASNASWAGTILKGYEPLKAPSCNSFRSCQNV